MSVSVHTVHSLHETVICLSTVGGGAYILEIAVLPHTHTSEKKNVKENVCKKERLNETENESGEAM